MRTSLLILVLFLAIPASHTIAAVSTTPAAANPKAIPTNAANTTAIPTTHGDTSFAKGTKHSKKLYDRGKGTVGFLSGLILGPVGYLGVHVLSHNRTQRKRAKDGVLIWTTAVVTAAFIWLIVIGSKGGNAPNLNLFSSSGDQNPRHRKKAAVELPLSTERISPSAYPVSAPPPAAQNRPALIP